MDDVEAVEAPPCLLNGRLKGGALKSGIMEESMADMSGGVGKLISSPRPF